MVRWVITPPTFPCIVWPWTANWAKHVAAENPGADVSEASRDNVVIDARCSTTASMHSLECGGGLGPLVEFRSSNAEWIVDTLARAGAEAINGY
jgi:hypothetical protein